MNAHATNLTRSGWADFGLLAAVVVIIVSYLCFVPPEVSRQELQGLNAATWPSIWHECDDQGLPCGGPCNPPTCVLTLGGRCVPQEGTGNDGVINPSGVIHKCVFVLWPSLCYENALPCWWNAIATCPQPDDDMGEARCPPGECLELGGQGERGC
jgi:hypothetical protein